MGTGVEVQQLRERHHELELKIEAENARPSSDDAQMALLKKQKLRIKDEIQRIEDTA